jgi:Na+-translocating ferredoxin:NAD+ oxidoreductase RnfG subunit
MGDNCKKLIIKCQDVCWKQARQVSVELPGLGDLITDASNLINNWNGWSFSGSKVSSRSSRLLWKKKRGTHSSKLTVNDKMLSSNERILSL